MFIGFQRRIRLHKQGRSETPCDTGPSHFTGAESDEEKKVITLHSGWLQRRCCRRPTLLRWPRIGLKRSGFKVFNEISAAHDFAGGTAPCQFQRCPPQNRHLPPERRTVEFPGWDEITKPPPIWHFIRFLLTAVE